MAAVVTWALLGLLAALQGKDPLDARSARSVQGLDPGGTGGCAACAGSRPCGQGELAVQRPAGQRAIRGGKSGRPDVVRDTDAARSRSDPVCWASVARFPTDKTVKSGCLGGRWGLARGLLPGTAHDNHDI